MNCFRCYNKVQWFSTRCDKCTTEFGILELWMVNLVARIVFFSILAAAIYVGFLIF